MNASTEQLLRISLSIQMTTLIEITIRDRTGTGVGTKSRYRATIRGKRTREKKGRHVVPFPLPVCIAVAGARRSRHLILFAPVPDTVRSPQPCPCPPVYTPDPVEAKRAQKQGEKANPFDTTTTTTNTKERPEYGSDASMPSSYNHNNNPPCSSCRNSSRGHGHTGVHTGLLEDGGRCCWRRVVVAHGRLPIKGVLGAVVLVAVVGLVELAQPPVVASHRRGDKKRARWRLRGSLLVLVVASNRCEYRRRPTTGHCRRHGHLALRTAPIRLVPAPLGAAVVVAARIASAPFVLRRVCLRLDSPRRSGQ